MDFFDFCTSPRKVQKNPNSIGFVYCVNTKFSGICLTHIFPGISGSWFSGIMAALGAAGLGFDSRRAPFCTFVHNVSFIE